MFQKTTENVKQEILAVSHITDLQGFVSKQLRVVSEVVVANRVKILRLNAQKMTFLATFKVTYDIFRPFLHLMLLFLLNISFQMGNCDFSWQTCGNFKMTLEIKDSVRVYFLLVNSFN